MHDALGQEGTGGTCPPARAPGPSAGIRSLLESRLNELLGVAVDHGLSLVAQGLDSLRATELLETLEAHGLEVDYEFLLEEATLESVLERLRDRAPTDLHEAPKAGGSEPVPLTGPQRLWADLEQRGWGAWSNISLCLSMPASLLPATRLPAIVQMLYDRNDAMRMVLCPAGASQTGQRRCDDEPLDLRMSPAPSTETDAIRLVEQFEGEEASPFLRSTRALVLTARGVEGRHWLCITMHHVFCDRLSMQSIARQLRAALLNEAGCDDVAPRLDWVQHALNEHRRPSGDSGTDCEILRTRIAEGRAWRSRPRLHEAHRPALSDLPVLPELGPEDHAGLVALAARLETTLPLLVHGVFGALASRLINAPGEQEASPFLSCHVVANRQHSAALGDLVGCLDTSVPVFLEASPRATFQAICEETRRSFTGASRWASGVARGEWLPTEAGDGPTARAATLIECIPHVNVVIAPEEQGPACTDGDIREHPIRRVQKTRWGLLLRVRLPRPEPRRSASRAGAASEPPRIELRCFSEDQALADALQHTLTATLRLLARDAAHGRGEARIAVLIDAVLERARRASEHVRTTAALVRRATRGEPFIYERLVERQQRWYEHDSNFALVRDEHNRFVGTALNPFPFTQLDKLRERAYLESLGVPLPELLHELPGDDIEVQLPTLAPSLPASFAIKPVGAGHSFGVTVVRDGKDLTRGSVPFDSKLVARELASMAARGYCVHEGHTFPFNFSSFLIEALVEDACGHPAPTDYKIFAIASELLWIQLHFEENGQRWVAFCDADFRLLEQPAWDPVICWRTHGALVCTDQEMVDARVPACAQEIVLQARSLAIRLGVFARLDWYADARRGPLLGELTTFPHILQPRGFYTPWANALVQAHWRDPDGVCVAPRPTASEQAAGARLVNDLLESRTEAATGLVDFIWAAPETLWSPREAISFGALRSFITDFDLSGRGVPAGARVALLVSNGMELGALLLAVMNRYVAVPLGVTQPLDYRVAQLEDREVAAVVTLAGTPEARDAARLCSVIHGLLHIEVNTRPGSPLPSLPAPRAEGPIASASTRSLGEVVLELSTSGTSGAPKHVPFTLRRLVSSSWMIGRSLNLSGEDLGLSLLPLHHVGGIACNLVAPLLAAGATRFRESFAPRRFFDDLAGPQGASWCYLVPTLWRQVLAYAAEHPELESARPWPRLRFIRSAGAELPHDLAVRLAEFFGPTVAVLPTYGMTEAMPIASPDISYRLEHPDSVGVVLPGVEIEIVDPDGGSDTPPLPGGQIGEVTVRGKGVVEPDSTLAPGLFTIRGYFRTGDLGVLASDGSGRLSLRGRIRDAINRGGEILAPSEIEAALRAFPGWGETEAELMAFARTHPELGEDVALAVGGLDDPTLLRDLNDWAARVLPRALLPRTLISLEALPISAAGKFQRAQFSRVAADRLPARRSGMLQAFKEDPSTREWHLVLEIAEGESASPTPQVEGDPTIELVLEVIRDVLGAEAEVEADSDLHAAGVNSLAAVEIATRLNDRFQSDLPEWAASDHPTARALLALLLEARPGAPATTEQRPPLPAPVPKAASRPLRLLFLHGEASDARLAELSLRATRWVEQMEGRIEFLFVDAPHSCAPRPEFHDAAVAAGLYEATSYRSWGSTDAMKLASSLAHLDETLRELAPVDAIGGICDGALVAARLAAERPEFRLFLNIAGGPCERLAGDGGLRSWSIPCPSVHLLSQRDQLHPYPELLGLPARCEHALVLQHDAGHAVPPLRDSLLEAFRDALDRATDGPALMPPTSDTADAPPRQHADAAPSDAGLEAQGWSWGRRDRRDRQVRRVMSRVLRRDDFGLDDSFFDLGGNSLAAMELALELERAFRVKLPVEAVLLDSASARSLARAIDAQVREDSAVTLVPFTSGGVEAPLYALPTLGGHLSDYLTLSKCLERHAAIVGVRHESLLRQPWRRLTIDQIARDASEALLQRHASGPIALVGFSIAGVFAFETARRLAAAGLTPQLFLVDAAPGGRASWIPEPLRHLRRLGRYLGWRMFGSKKVNHSWRYVDYRLFSELVHWKPRPASLNGTVLFSAEHGMLVRPDLVRTWAEALHGELRVELVPGGHVGLREQGIAERIADDIAAALKVHPDAERP